LSHRGVGQLLDTVHDVQRLTNADLRVRGVLPTLFDARTAHGRAVLVDISARYVVTVLQPPIARSVRFAEAPGSGRSILTTARRSRGAEAYRSHARALVEAESAAGAPQGARPRPGAHERQEEGGPDAGARVSPPAPPALPALPARSPARPPAVTPVVATAVSQVASR
ncbi:ParA family protein, partial [Candidatus Protofrankia californiensis]|uniref:ParA family protein n=1 Tax=Candidatus Protofrankia californiensis TaxID=1839754 RepID=UPI003D357F74